MKPGIPWSVKGIGNEAREAAKLAAHRSGMTLGEWLNRVILDQADEIGAYPPPQGEAPVREALGNLAEELARLTRTDQGTSASRLPESMEPDEEDVERVIERLEANERQTFEAIASVNERLNALSSEVANAGRAATPQKPEDVPGYLALESALRSIVDHLEASEKRNRETTRSMQERIGDLTQRAERPAVPAPIEGTPAIARIEGRLHDLTGRVETAERASQYELPNLVEREVAKLAGHIETVRQSSEAAAERAQTAAAAAAQRELREIEGRIHGLIRDTQTMMRSQGVAPADIQRLQGDLESVNQRLDDLKADAASERDMHQLRVAVEQLAARIAQGPDLRPLADMDRRLAELAERIDRSPEANLVAGHLGELDKRIRDLDGRLAAALRQNSGERAVEGLRQQIAEMSQRLGHTEQQLSHLATLDRSIQQLYESLEQSRQWSQQIAEDAANRMADRLMQSLPQGGFAAAAPSHELRALEDGLAAVRAQAQAADQRNQETLEAVHETLEQIVARLAEMEMAPPPAAAAPLPVAHYEPEPMPVPMADWTAPRFESPTVREPVAVAPQLDSFSLPPVDVPPADEPVPRFDVAADPAQYQRDDFIAAARRAAQAAAADQAKDGTIPGNQATMLPPPRRGFKFPSLRLPGFKSAAPALDRGPMSAMPKPMAGGNRRRQLILAGLVLLAAVSALTVRNILTGSDAPAPKQDPVRSSAPAEPAPAPEPPAGAQPPKPRPSELEGGLPSPEAGARTGESVVPATDGILTASLPNNKTDASIAALVSDRLPPASGEAPPPAAGSESLRSAAAAGNPRAQFVVASRYLDGQGVEQNLVEAARWYQKAAAQGLAPAQYRIATMFERGRGVASDAQAALVWYERAAALGNVKAMHNAAVIHSGGTAGTPAYEKAAQLFSSAAEHGLKDSQFNLAVLYERGLGVKPSMGEALFWYSLAARQDDADARKKAAALEQSLAPSTVDQVGARLEAWKARPSLESANVVAIDEASWQDASPKEAMAAPLPRTVAGEQLILRAQELLGGLGYEIGKPDGRAGSRTANAVRLFQLKSGMKVTGEVTPELIAELEAAAG